jgi:hypothetical protein
MPDPRLAGGLAVTSWGCLLTLQALDPVAVSDFVSTNAGRYDHGWQHTAGPAATGQR